MALVRGLPLLSARFSALKPSASLWRGPKAARLPWWSSGSSCPPAVRGTRRSRRGQTSSMVRRIVGRCVEDGGKREVTSQRQEGEPLMPPLSLGLSRRR